MRTTVEACGSRDIQTSGILKDGTGIYANANANERRTHTRAEAKLHERGYKFYNNVSFIFSRRTCMNFRTTELLPEYYLPGLPFSSHR